MSLNLNQKGAGGSGFCEEKKTRTLLIGVVAIVLVIGGGGLFYLFITQKREPRVVVESCHSIKLNEGVFSVPENAIAFDAIIGSGGSRESFHVEITYNSMRCIESASATRKETP